MLSIATGYDPRYLTGEVAKGTENYYTREVKRGEPPGVWNGRGVADLGLAGQVGDKEMQALFVHFVDPRDPLFLGSRKGWKHAARLGRPPRKYATVDELLASALVREPDAAPERVEQLRRQAERQVRKAVTFIDLTFGVPKSFSILHTALRAQEMRAHEQGDAHAAREWARKAETLEQSIWAGNNAALQFLQQHAGYSRAGYHGVRSPTGATVGRWIDAHGWIVASFLQHTNRNEDMHLHIHNAVLNRVLCTDGVWRTLDSRAIHRLRGAAGAIAERVMTEQAIAQLGLEVRWSPDGHTLEIVGISAQARTVFSSRRRQVTAAVKDLAEGFEQRHGRAPNALELSQLSLWASKATRPGKKHLKESTSEQLRRWEQQLRSSIDQTLADIAHQVPGRVPQPVADVFDPAMVIALAVHQVQADRSAWTRYDLMRALNSQLPPCLGAISAERVVGLLHELADRALNPQSRPGEVICLAAPDLIAVPDELRLADGRSMFDAPAETVYATRGHLAAEESLIHAVTASTANGNVDPATVDDALHALATAGFELGADQTAAVRGLLTSNRQVNVLIGPAGTGKSFTLGMLARLWEQHAGHKVIGLATGQRAAHVLAEEGFTRTDNVHRWLQRQARLDFKTSNTSDREYRLEPGDLMVLDEATMTPTAELAAIWARCAAVGARLVVVGDERQLGAVGAGGALRLMAEHADVHTLQEVRRFAQTWEAQASLLLRDGDTHAISVYERHGRLVEGGTAEHTAALAARAWLADTLAGHQSLLIVATEEEAAEVSARLRASLVDLGKVSQHGIRLHHHGATGTVAGPGDVIQTRRNDWTLRDPAGRAVINRDLWHVTAIASDGGLWARRIIRHQQHRELGPPIRLPAAYVAGHVTLGYAVTAHSSQGTTVDTCYPIISATMSAAALYVAMTRGRLHSVAHVVTTHIADRAPENAKEVNGIRPGHLHRTPGQVLTAIMDRATADVAAIRLQDELLIASGSLPVLGSRWAEAHALAGSRHLAAVLNLLQEQNQLSASLCESLQRDEAWGSLQRLLRTAQLAGHDPQHLLRQALSERQVDTARSVAQVLHWRITRRHGDRLIPQGDTWTERTISGEDPISRYAVAVAEAMDLRCGQLGEHTAANPPTWATQRLGVAPDDIVAKAEWIRRAGIVTGYREQYRVDGDDDRDPLGPCPKPGLPEARAAWFAAWRALGSPTDLAAETSMTVTELVAAVHTYNRARLWAPDWVGDRLRDANETARADHQATQLARARADLHPPSPHRKELLETAHQHARWAEQHTKMASDLAAIDDARAAWHAHTDPARQAARRAIAELDLRNLDPFGNLKPVQPRAVKREQPHPHESAVAFRGDIRSALARAATARQRITDEETSAIAQQRSLADELEQQATTHER